jgi:hypothetical protein
MNRYTTKHFWRMTESEEGEWVRYEELERLRMERDSYRELYREANKDHCDMALHYLKAQRLAIRYKFRVIVLTGVLIVNFIVFVAKLIGWSLGL